MQLLFIDNSIYLRYRFGTIHLISRGCFYNPFFIVYLYWMYHIEILVYQGVVSTTPSLFYHLL